MDWVHILSFAAVTALLVMSPGPNGVLIAKTVATSGKNAGFANIAGFMSAFYVHGALSILGVSVLLMQSAEAFFIFKLLGAAYLCWIGIKALLGAWRNENPRVTPSAPKLKKQVSFKSAFLEGFLTNALNPKVSMFYLAAFPQFIPADNRIASALLLVSIHALINMLWFSTMIILLSRLKHFSTSPHLTRWLKSVTGTIFIGFGVKLALLKPLSGN